MNVVYPLVADIEVYYERFPISIFDEIRNFNDHIARCYRKGVTSAFREEQLKAARTHLARIKFESFKFLLVYLDDEAKRFQSQTKGIDLTLIDQGNFVNSLNKILDQAINAKREATKIEILGEHEEALAKYEEAFILYTKLNDFIMENRKNVRWAKFRTSLSRKEKVLWTLFGGFISYLIWLLFYNLTHIYNFFKTLF